MKVLESKGCYGTTSLEHPAVRMIASERKHFYLGGKIKGLSLPKRVFPCKTPSEVRESLPAGEDVVAFQCRNPIHRAHYELFTRALKAKNVSKIVSFSCSVFYNCISVQFKEILINIIIKN